MEYKKRWFFYDLHCHTFLSPDSPADIKNHIKIAKKRGLDGIAITNHNVPYKGPAEIDGVDVIPGTEVTTKEGEHILGYFLREKIEKGRSIEETTEEIKKKKGYAVWAHPLRETDIFLQRPNLVSFFHGIESGNAVSKKDQRDVVIKRCQEDSLLQTGGSDAHIEGQIGTAVLKVPEKIRRDNFLEALREGEVIVREEIKDFRKRNIYWKKIIRKIKKIIKTEKHPFLKKIFLKLILRNYFRIVNIMLKKIDFNYKNDH